MKISQLLCISVPRSVEVEIMLRRIFIKFASLSLSSSSFFIFYFGTFITSALLVVKK